MVFEIFMQVYDCSKVCEWYNGYSWGGEECLYNLFFILCFLQSGQYQNYWFEMGMLMFLVWEMCKYCFFNMFGFQIVINDLVNFDYVCLNFISVLFQIGYLMIWYYDFELFIYIFDYLNCEVCFFLEQFFMSEYMDYLLQGVLLRVVNIL